MEYKIEELNKDFISSLNILKTSNLQHQKKLPLNPQKKYLMK